MEPHTRVVQPTHGPDAQMGYKYRARVEGEVFGWIKKRQMFRCVIERHFMGWCDCEWGRWRTDPNRAIADANARLDRLSRPVMGRYVAASPLAGEREG